MAFVGNLAAAKPEALDNVDFDETVREYADLTGDARNFIVAQQQSVEGRMRGLRQMQQQQAGADVDGGAARGKDFE